MADTPLTDPLGRTVTLHNHTWYGHILQRHRELRTYRTLVHQAVTQPLEIRISDAEPAAVRLYFGNGPRPGMMIVVAADIVAGHVRTAHLVKAMKGAPEWSRPTP